MRIFSVLASATVIALSFGIEPTRSLDGTPSSPQAALSPVDAMRNATEALKTGEKTRAVTSLQYAAEHGHGFALWQLGRMYAEGDGVARDDYRAFEYFQKFADTHADENPAIPRSRFVANAFVALGHYYLEGIPNTAVSASPELARRMFAHAASYFGDSEAQYQLATLYLDGKESGAVEVPAAITTVSRLFSLGGNPTFAGPEFLAADFAELLLRNRALSTDEIGAMVHP